MLAKYTPVPTKKDPSPSAQIGSIWVEFNAEESVGLKHLREYMQHLVNGSFYSGVLVCMKPVTGMAARLLRGSSSMTDGPKGGMEVFVEQDLLVNITKHELVPKHVLLSDEEIFAGQKVLVRAGLTVEPAGAAAFAAVLHGALPPELLEGRSRANPLRVAAVISGGNPDPAQLASLLG